MFRRAHSVSCVVLFLLGSSMAFAEVGKEPTRSSSVQPAEKVLTTWTERLDDIESLILQGDVKQAGVNAEKLWRKMLGRTQTHEGMGDYLGRLFVLRAVAAAEQGLDQEALWHWQIGGQLFPEIAGSDLSVFGDAGQFLLDHSLDSKEESVGDEGESTVSSQEAKPSDRGIKRPRKIKAPRPRFPSGKSTPVNIVLASKIDTDGVVTQPQIVKATGDFAGVCAGLEAIRQWRFKPARANGVPIEVAYMLTANF